MQSRGFICVDSQLGSGTTFTIYLPATDEPVEQVEPMQAPLTLSGGTETVLLVEDAPIVRAFIARALRTYGYTVLQAANGEEALRNAAAQTFDLLLTDIVMPGMNGLELAGRVIETYPRARVMLMSGYDESCSPGSIAGQPVRRIRKPFTATALADAVRSALDGERSDRSTG